MVDLANYGSGDVNKLNHRSGNERKIRRPKTAKKGSFEDGGRRGITK